MKRNNNIKSYEYSENRKFMKTCMEYTYKTGQALGLVGQCHCWLEMTPWLNMKKEIVK